ncbi:MAG: SCP2 sterol-binding domain-containing protein [Desulfurococcales archaeon]|nr:SCP2 sterol-binding domain-containing protein [Desulfurococcales archaeon]
MEELRNKLLDIFKEAKEKMPEISSWSKVYQFVVEGDGEFYIEISNGEAKIVEGKHPSPIATLTASKEVFEKILSGELDAMKAFMTRQLKISGNVLDTMNLKKMIDAGLGKA